MTTSSPATATGSSGDTGRALAREHLEAGAELVAWGEGEVESKEPVVIAGVTLVMMVRD